jgi:hypothetical protein
MLIGKIIFIILRQKNSMTLTIALFFFDKNSTEKKIKESPFLQNKEHFLNEMKYLETAMYKQFKTQPKIACFSENIESTLMWAHYASSHEGFALEYDFREEQSVCLKCEKRCKNSALMNLLPVLYSEKRYNATSLVEWYLINSELIESALREYGVPLIPDRLAYIKANLYKGKDWKYEKEWRSILICNGNPERKEVIVKPRAIYLGAEIIDVYQDILVKYAKEKGIKIYKMKVDNYAEEYKLTYKIFNK